MAKTDVEKMMESFDKERDQWEKDYKDVLQKVLDYKSHTDGLTLMLSFRHMFVDKRARMKDRISVLKMKYDERYGQAYRKMAESQNIRDQYPSFYDRNAILKSNLHQIKAKIDLLESQSQYYQGCIETLDKVGFATKNKIDYDKFNMGGY